MLGLVPRPNLRAGVRGTSIALYANKIHVLQSQNANNAVQFYINNEYLQFVKNAEKCSEATISGEDITIKTGNNIADPYCFDIKDETLQKTVIDFTAKDKDYLTQINHPEREIAWPKRLRITKVKGSENEYEYELSIDGIGRVKGEKSNPYISFDLSNYLDIKIVLDNLYINDVKNIFEINNSIQTLQSPSRLYGYNTEGSIEEKPRSKIYNNFVLKVNPIENFNGFIYEW